MVLSQPVGSPMIKKPKKAGPASFATFESFNVFVISYLGISEKTGIQRVSMPLAETLYRVVWSHQCPFRRIHLLSSIPSSRETEIIETLHAAPGVRLERIISFGQTSPEGFWYDQHEAEWVVVLSGRARLKIEGEAEERVLEPGDAMLLPSHCRHRVTWTDPGVPTIWLAVFFDDGSQSHV
jgi:cupin 2 domain-containing protein